MHFLFKIERGENQFFRCIKRSMLFRRKVLTKISLSIIEVPLWIIEEQRRMLQPNARAAVTKRNEMSNVHSFSFCRHFYDWYRNFSRNILYVKFYNELFLSKTFSLKNHTSISWNTSKKTDLHTFQPFPQRKRRSVQVTGVKFLSLIKKGTLILVQPIQKFFRGWVFLYWTTKT